ncbi:RodZ domain-containing protein [Marinobacter sp. ANT_B65]|uniref:RodZ domain-containing protein n=1 Tax=Marinobacter sp. ANT_B65 TaxID=2039467 RepID=UPI000BBF2ACA|nr:RodZ domain-containing protein [Marinobacter sp. ANT_B65]PCM46055.1 helix-turn-helix domain-containing protein [Marinobacter sp. ANT_B65]
MTSDDLQQSVSTETVGQQLKTARERHGLSVAQIADAQHLRSCIIQAIESGDYGKIDSELFLKGYVRAYARQVSLDADAVIADLNRELEPLRQQKVRELEASPLVNIERRRRRKRRIGKLLLLVTTLVLVGALVVMFVIPRFSPGEAGAPVSTLSGPDESLVKDEPAVASDSLQSTNSEGRESGTGTTIASPDNDLAGAADPASPENPDAVDTSMEQSAAAEVEEAAAAPQNPIESDQIPVVAQSTEPALAQPLVSDESGIIAGRLEIDFTGDCWVQVRDATGARLASSLKRAGDKLEVSGEVPLKVVIGAVDTVKAIRFQGKVVDISDFPVVNNRSEFTLTI